MPDDLGRDPEKPATYQQAGVDIDAGARLVELIEPLARRTARAGLLSGLGGFGGLFAVPPGIVNPVLVSGTDGVGTKLKIAFALDRHDTIGIDLVAMSVNDVVVTGAEPLFFLDYFATSKLDPERAARVIAGIARGCELAGCALLGGETAELPGFYGVGEYNLAGFCVGVVAKKAILDGTRAQAGDVVLGLASSGLHSNGYSLARRVLGADDAGELTRPGESPGRTLGDDLLEPTRIYVKALLALLARVPGALHGAAHITGGGLVENPPRMLPPGLGIDLKEGSWPVPKLFARIASAGRIEPLEMRRTFNMGLGMLLAVDRTQATLARAALEAAGETVFEVGVVVPHVTAEPAMRFVGLATAPQGAA